MIDFGAILQNLQPFLPYILGAFGASIVLTPIAGKLAGMIGALDLPAHMRSRADRTAERRIHTDVVPKFAGLVLIVPILIGLLASGGMTELPWGIIAGVVVLFVGGMIDDIVDLTGRQQLIFHIIAAVLVVLSGVSITYIQILGVELDLAILPTTLGLAGYQLLLPADLITILWIVAIINFVNWIDGVDGVHGSLTIIVTATLMLIMVKDGSVMPALIVLNSLLLGANLGFIPFNLFPAKIFYGSSGSYVNGFLLAVLGIMSTSKLATTIITLGLPLFDAILVIVLRLREHPEALRNPIKILSISDKNHLHHRLLDIGFSKRVVWLIEVVIMLILCVVAFYFSGFDNDALILISAVIVIGIIFVIISISRRRAAVLAERRLLEEQSRPKVEVKYATPTGEPGEKYTY